jgi:hypothetical protein
MTLAVILFLSLLTHLSRTSNHDSSFSIILVIILFLSAFASFVKVCNIFVIKDSFNCGCDYAEGDDNGHNNSSASILLFIHEVVTLGATAAAALLFYFFITFDLI